MAQVFFTDHLRRFVDCPPAEVSGRTVREVLGQVFDRNPRLRGYVLDDQGAVRYHISVFLDGRQIRDRRGLSDAVSENAEINVIQALSGG